jgi:tetratricopeptide (TPR) repeat protein
MYQEALALDDRDYRVWGGLGSAHYRIPAKHDEAAVAFQQALERAEKRLEVNPHDGEVICHIAGYHQALGHSNRARELLEEALKLAPNDLEVMFHSGNTYEALGDRDEALKWITKAVKGGYSLAQVDRAPELQELKEDPRFARMLRSD